MFGELRRSMLQGGACDASCLAGKLLAVWHALWSLAASVRASLRQVVLVGSDRRRLRTDKLTAAGAEAGAVQQGPMSQVDL